MPTVLISAGDLSGEQHAAELVRALDSGSANVEGAQAEKIRFVGLGGPAMAAAGVDVRVDQRALAVGGFFEVISGAAGVLRAGRQLLRVAEEVKPDLVILVDSGGFHLPFARRLKKKIKAPILYYVPPQVWAWRPERLRRVAEVSDRIAVILPFEPEVYRAEGVDVDFVGHPLLDRFPSLASGSPERDAQKKASRAGLGISETTASVPLIGLFPGSRRSEVSRHLPIQIESFRRLRQAHPDLQAVLAVASSLDASAMEAWLNRLAGDLRSVIRVHQGDSRAILPALDVALAKPGTITLELLLHACPMVVMGRAHPLTARIVRRSLRVAFLAMPNLLADERIVPELIQNDAKPADIAMELEGLLAGPAREKQLLALEAIRARLGTTGASRRTAQIVEEMLGHSPT